MSIEDLEEERRYREAAEDTGRERIFETPVRSLDVPPAVVVSLETPVAEIVKRMEAAGVGAVLVAGADGRIAGIFTERDLLLRVVAKGLDLAGTPAKSVMSKDPDCLTLDDTLGFALHKMVAANHRSVPVADEEGRPVGILTQQHGVRALASLFPAAVYNQPPRSFEQKPPRNQHGG